MATVDDVLDFFRPLFRFPVATPPAPVVDQRYFPLPIWTSLRAAVSDGPMIDDSRGVATSTHGDRYVINRVHWMFALESCIFLYGDQPANINLADLLASLKADEFSVSFGAWSGTAAHPWLPGSQRGWVGASGRTDGIDRMAALLAAL